MNILHLLQTSYPLVSGSTIRTNYIFKFARKFSTIIGLTSFLYDRDFFLEIIDGIPYYRIDHRINKLIRRYLKIKRIINRFLLKHFKVYRENQIFEFIITKYFQIIIQKLIKIYKIDIIHGHSHFRAAKYGLKVAKKKNIPFVYEVRGFTEKNLISDFKSGNYSKDQKILSYLDIKLNETRLMLNSDLVVTLSNSMKYEIINRGVQENKIIIVPNGTDPNQLKPVKKNQNLLLDLKLHNTIIIGYIGRISWYEGIEILIKALPILLKEISNVKILLVGKINDDYRKFLSKIIEDLNLKDYVIINGPVPHEKISKFYSIMDFVILPRLNIDVCRIVTPLKPLEAMAFKKFILVSKLPAFQNIIIPGETGDFFKPEDSRDLATKVIYYLNHSEKKLEIENSVRNFVKERYAWKKIVPLYEEAYKLLLNKTK